MASRRASGVESSLTHPHRNGVRTDMEQRGDLARPPPTPKLNRVHRASPIECPAHRRLDRAVRERLHRGQARTESHGSATSGTRALGDLCWVGAGRRRRTDGQPHVQKGACSGRRAVPGASCASRTPSQSELTERRAGCLCHFALGPGYRVPDLGGWQLRQRAFVGEPGFTRLPHAANAAVLVGAGVKQMARRTRLAAQTSRFRRPAPDPGGAFLTSSAAFAATVDRSGWVGHGDVARA